MAASTIGTTWPHASPPSGRSGNPVRATAITWRRSAGPSANSCRRVSGRSLGTFFREEIAEPLDLDFWIGLPAAHIPRVAPMIPWVPDRGGPRPPFTQSLLTDPTSIPSLAFLNRGNHQADSPQAYASEFGAGGGIANARALAGMYTPLANGGEHAGVRLVSADHIVRMREISAATQLDATLLMPTRFSLGFMRSMDNRHRPTGAHGVLSARRRGVRACGRRRQHRIRRPERSARVRLFDEPDGGGHSAEPARPVTRRCDVSRAGLSHQRTGRMDTVRWLFIATDTP